VVSSATTVLFQTNPTSGGNIIFNMNRFGVAWPLAITRTGGIAFSHGQQISVGQGTALGNLNIQAGSTATGTGNTLFLASGGSGTGPLARGVFSDGAGFTIGTRPSGGATAFNSSVFDLNGGLTLPKSLVVGTTATVTTLKFGDGSEMTTAATGGSSTSTYYNLTATNELRVGPEDGLGQLRFYRDGTNGLSIGNTDPGNDYLMINNQRWIYLNPTSTNPADSSAVIVNEQDPNFSILRVNKITPISTYTNVEIASSLAVTNTATANELRVGADSVAIKSQGFNVIGVDNNWRVGNVLEVGNGSSGYITSTGNNDLILQTSGNDGPGGSINIGYGATAGVNLYSGASQEFSVAVFNTLSNTINYGLTINGQTTVSSLRFGTETAITSRSELIGPTGPAGSTGALGPTGPAGDYSGTERVYAFGNTSGTIAADATSATIFTMTLNGNLTMNALTNVVTGSNATFVITQDGTGGRTLTSSWKFAGGAKTLTTAGTATDMISVFYDGSTYYASLSRGFV